MALTKAGTALFQRMGKRPLGAPKKLTLAKAVEYINEVAETDAERATLDDLRALLKAGVLRRRTIKHATIRVFQRDLAQFREAVQEGRWTKYLRSRLPKRPSSPGPVPGKPPLRVALFRRWYPETMQLRSNRLEDIERVPEGVQGDPVLIAVPNSDSVTVGGFEPGFRTKVHVLPFDQAEIDRWLKLCWQDELYNDEHRTLDPNSGPREFPEDLDHLFRLGYLRAETAILRHTDAHYVAARALLRRKPPVEEVEIFPESEIVDYDPFAE